MQESKAARASRSSPEPSNECEPRTAEHLQSGQRCELRGHRDSPLVASSNGRQVQEMQPSPQPFNQLGTLRDELNKIESNLRRRERGLPEPLPDEFFGRLIVTLLARADELRPVLWRVLRRNA